MSADPMLQKYRNGEAFVDSESGEPVAETGGCWVEFHMGTAPDQLLTEGGIIEKSHPQVRDIQRMEREALALLKQQEPFPEEEPQPPAKDATPADKRAYEEAHGDWDARRKAHEASLAEQARILREYPDSDKVWEVRPVGRPIFRDVEMIRIRIPGDRDNIVDRQVRKSDIAAYREQYNRWKSGKQQQTTGTPLAQWPKVTAAQVEELAYFGVRTVEQLAATSDVNLQNIGPYMQLRQQARDWIATARGTAPVEEARAEARRASEEAAELRRQLADLQAAVAEMRGTKPQQVAKR